MAPAFQRIFRQAIDLPQEEREFLTDLLLDTLASPIDPDIASAWHEELDRRVREMDSGVVTGSPWEDVRARLRKRLHAKGKKR